MVNISALKANVLKFIVGVDYNPDLSKPFEEILMSGCSRSFFRELPLSLPISERIGSGKVSKNVYLIGVSEKFQNNKAFFDHIEDLGYCFDWLATATLAERFPYVIDLGFGSLMGINLGQPNERTYGVTYQNLGFNDHSRKVVSYEFPMRGEIHGWIAVVDTTERKSFLRRKFYARAG